MSGVFFGAVIRCNPNTDRLPSASKARIVAAGEKPRLLVGVGKILVRQIIHLLHCFRYQNQFAARGEFVVGC